MTATLKPQTVENNGMKKSTLPVNVVNTVKPLPQSKTLFIQKIITMSLETELLEKAKKEAAERIKKGAAEGKNPTQIVMEMIEEKHLETGEDISSLRVKYQSLEKDVYDLKCKSSTGSMFGGSNKSASNGFRENISQVIGENLEGLKGLYTGSTKQLRMETKTVGDMLISTNLTGGTASINAPVIGPVGMTYRLNNVQDLLRQTTMTGGKLPVLKDNGGEGVPTPVSEGGEKPSVDFDLAEADAKAEVIAATTTVSKQFFEDIPNSRQWLIDRLTELWQGTLNDQLLNGDGVSPNLKGLNETGNFTAASGGSTIPVEQLVQGLLQMRTLKRRASGIIINPASLEYLMLNKATGSMEYDLPAVVSINNVGQLMVMGVPVIDVEEQPADTFTIHDNSGSLLAWRQGLTIEFFNEIYAKTNKILIRIEARLAFPVYGASYTINGTFQTP